MLCYLIPKVKFDRRWLGIIALPPEYHSQVEGLCGNFDGDPANDQIGQDGVDYSSDSSGHSLMGNTWKVYDPWQPT